MSYKDYLYDVAPKKAIEKKELTKELTDDQAFQLVIALVAAEEGANIISDELRRTVMMQGGIAPTVSPEGVPVAMPAPREKIWATRKFDAANTTSKTITGGRQMLEITGPGKVIETILIADVDTIGMQIIIDGDLLYSGTYSKFLETTKADSNLSAYYDEGLSKYVLRVSRIGFENQFVFIVTCIGTVEFDVIRCNYEVLVEV